MRALGDRQGIVEQFEPLAKFQNLKPNADHKLSPAGFTIQFPASTTSCAMGGQAQCTRLVNIAQPAGHHGLEILRTKIVTLQVFSPLLVFFLW